MISLATATGASGLARAHFDRRPRGMSSFVAKLIKILILHCSVLETCVDLDSTLQTVEAVKESCISNTFFQETNTCLSKPIKKELDLESCRCLCKALLGHRPMQNVFGEAKRLVNDLFTYSYVFWDSLRPFLYCQLVGIVAGFDQCSLNILRAERLWRDLLPNACLEIDKTNKSCLL